MRRHLGDAGARGPPLYRELGLVALRLAREAGLAEASAGAVERALTDDD